MNSVIGILLVSYLLALVLILGWAFLITRPPATKGSPSSLGDPEPGRVTGADLPKPGSSKFDLAEPQVSARLSRSDL